MPSLITSTQRMNLMNWSRQNDIPEHVFYFEAHHNTEIRSGCQIYKNNDDTGNVATICPQDFPLPTLGPRLSEIAHTLHSGSGFAVLRGLDTKSLSPEDNLIVYLGIASYIGSQRGAQNKKRDMVTHITDAKQWSNVPHSLRHGIHTNSGLPFHTDMGCEILALQYRAVAQQGGVTSLASATTIVHELRRDHPAALAALMASEWPVQLTGSPARFSRLPLLAEQDDGRVVISVDPGRLGLHPATAGLREGKDCDLTQDQLSALEVLAKLAKNHAISVAAQPGDILFINNLAMLHKRDAYTDTDSDDPAATGQGGRRHLVRLWLRNPELAWEIPEAMKAPWRAAYGPQNAPNVDGVGRFLKAGMPIEDRYQVVPEKEYKVPKYSSGSAAWLIEVDEA